MLVIFRGHGMETDAQGASLSLISLEDPESETQIMIIQ